MLGDADISVPAALLADPARARISGPRPIRSLRQGTRAHAIREARFCYDHLAGRLEVGLMGALIERGALRGGDGQHHPHTAVADRLSAPGHDIEYRLTGRGAALMGEFGIDVVALGAGRRPLVRCCLDWSEQRHHLAGALGAALATGLLDRGWLRRARAGRAALLTDDGRAGLAQTFGYNP